jgi:glycosyltransferase involved in cell wall biosynthesis
VHIITFGNLFPSSVMPTHGIFVYERMRRVAEMSGCRWTVVAPVPAVMWPLRRGIYRKWAKVPLRETWHGVDVYHPRYRHLPGISVSRQADAVAKGSRQVVSALVQGGGSVLDVHYVWPDGVAAGMLANELGVPFTLTARGTDVNVLAQDAQLANRIADAAGRAHQCMAVSTALAQRFADACSMPREQVVTVRNGVDLERFAPGDQAQARAELGLPANGHVALGVGRLITTKGFDVAARAVQTLAHAHLVLIGDGPEQQSIEVAGGGCVTFLGALPPEKVAVACRAADVFVLPTHREGWPNVVTEALASGLPVVATPVGGIPQIMGGADVAPHLGALVEVGDVVGFASAMKRVFNDGKQTAKVRAFAENYGWQEPVEQLVSTFRRAVGETVA